MLNRADFNSEAKDQYKDSSNLDARIALHQRFSLNKQGWYSWLFDHYQNFPPNSRILELGSGSGAFWKANAQRIPPGWDVTLSDFSFGMAQEARRAAGNLPVWVQQLNAQAIPYATHTFDVVIANHMIYHIPDRPKAFAEIRRVLKPNGILFAATNGLNHMGGLLELVLRTFPERLEDIEASWLTSHALTFRLENGAEQLTPWFSDVQLLPRYEDGLHVTETEPLVAYIASMLDGRIKPFKSELDRLHNTIEAEIRANGAIDIPKDTGAFLCKV